MIVADPLMNTVEALGHYMSGWVSGYDFNGFLAAHLVVNGAWS